MKTLKLKNGLCSEYAYKLGYKDVSVYENDRYIITVQCYNDCCYKVEFLVQDKGKSCLLDYEKCAYGYPDNCTNMRKMYKEFIRDAKQFIENN